MRVFIAYNLCCGGLLSLLDDGLALDRSLLLLGRALEEKIQRWGYVTTIMKWRKLLGEKGPELSKLNRIEVN